MRIELDDAYRLWRYRSSEATRDSADGKLIEALAAETRRLHSALNWIGCCSACREAHHRPDICPACIARKALEPDPNKAEPSGAPPSRNTTTEGDS